MPSFWNSLKKLFHLSEDTDREGAIKNIKDSMDFQGSNVWALIIAILIASIGLNLNSSAVIIGAMLISPLMGPIVGVGVGLGISDTQLLKRSLINLILMTVISLTASTLYFSITPLTGTTSEILARTSPTFFDVFIALLGGLALIIAITRKSKPTNLLAGVAIATALMPPLCTAGFGLANHNLSFFLGAFYLYMINSVFIGITSLVFAKYLNLHADQIQKPSGHPVFVYIMAVIIFVTPSIFMAYDLIQDTDFKLKADHFVQEHLQFPGTLVINVQKSRKENKNEISVALAGKSLTQDEIAQIKSQLAPSGLAGTELKIIQGDELAKTHSPADFNQTALTTKNLELSEELKQYTDKATILSELAKELPLLFPDLKTISFGEMLIKDSGQIERNEKYTIITYWDTLPNDEIQIRVKTWLKLRLKSELLEVVFLKKTFPPSSHE